MADKPVVWKEGRDSKTGEFITKKEVERRPSTTTTETLKRPR
jgi:hypothetical protein